MEPLPLSFRVCLVKDNADFKRRSKIFGLNSGANSSQNKVIDVEIQNFSENDSLTLISPTSFSLNQLISEIKKEIYNVTLPINNISLSSSSAVEDTKSLFNCISSTPKITRSLSLKNFIETEVNLANKDTLIQDFLKDCDISGILQKMKNKRKNTKQERLVVIKYSRILYYFSITDKKCRGIKCLDNCSILNKGENYFELKTGSSEKYTFFCNTAQECDQWTETIKKCLDTVEKSKFKVNGQLTGTIIKARNCASKDLNGLSDPFCYSRIERQQIKSQTSYKTLNPTWNEHFLFEITRHEGYFRVWVWDEDKFKSADFMGEIIYPLALLPPNQEVTMWLPLAPRTSKEKVSGDVQVRLKYAWSPESPQNSPTAFFGHSLSTLKSRTDIMLQNGLPQFLFEITEFLEKNALGEKGIFRENGGSIEIRSLRNTLDSGGKLHYSMDNVHNYTGVFKLYFRELPEPLFTFEQYDQLITLSRSKTINVIQLQDLFKQLPEPNLNLLKLVLPFFSKIADNSKYNMMNNSNLSIVFGPSFIRPKVESIQTHIEIVDVNNIMKLIFENSQAIIKSL
ncbi:pleckstrin (PH) domain-containing protein [Tieghemostelium lacteum]|uniref:Pleckstrin (PH) domain-containing protein n=1 Tax=Tieghemostelium lacteum TaxID=361077 RepID=A0A152A1L5_TIELA|nr:pleckstrin (PH) domain-containing protein [Tieghemostelium lacteum]|eukprot:KYR00089.1 pleckstrin (PH) domain-containing protein [Tieghemostelium lacteum]